MKKFIITLFILTILGGAGYGGYWYYTQNYAPAPENAVYVSEVSSLSAMSSGYVNRYAGVVEAQETVEVKIENGRKVKEVKVKTGDMVKKGQLLFEYDLSSIEADLQGARLDLEKLKNEAASLENQVNTLEKERKKASKDNQLSYTIEIETAKMNMKKNEYDQISKEAEIERLQNATGNTEVRSSIEGIIQKIDSSQMNSGDDGSVYDSVDDYGGFGYGYGDGSEDNAFIKILSTGEYRVKGSVNELNINFLSEGESILIRSRADETIVWHGVLGMIDRENASSANNNGFYWGMSDASDNETNSSTYPFYVELESSDGLMLGQHVYIEPDNGQMVSKTGVWLSEAYIVDIDTEEPYVWAADEKNRLEKRTVVLGQYNDLLGEYEILSGLTKSDYLAFPNDSLEAGLPTTTDEELAMDFDEAEWPEEDFYEDFGDMEFPEFPEFPEYDAEAFGEFEEIGEFEEVGEVGSADDMMDGAVIDDMEGFDHMKAMEAMDYYESMDDLDSVPEVEWDDMELMEDDSMEAMQ